MDIKDKISKWIRSSRKSAGLSGEDLGARLAFELGAEKGHSKANISHWELGRHEPSFSQILAISKITKCPLPIDIGQLTYDSKKQSEQVDHDPLIQSVIDLMKSTDLEGRVLIKSATFKTLNEYKFQQASLSKTIPSAMQISNMDISGLIDSGCVFTEKEQK